MESLKLPYVLQRGGVFSFSKKWVFQSLRHGLRRATSFCTREAFGLADTPGLDNGSLREGAVSRQAD